jgi:hypothetical protein
MLIGGHPGTLENCPVERVASVFNSRLNLLYRIPCLEVPATVLPILDS